jgi:hypothetical protein
MARLFLTNIDLNTNELQNAVIQNLSSAPSTGNKEGRIYYNVTNKALYLYTDGSWKPLASGGAAASSIELTGDVTGTASVDPATGKLTVSTTVGSSFVTKTGTQDLTNKTIKDSLLFKDGVNTASTVKATNARLDINGANGVTLTTTAGDINLNPVSGAKVNVNTDEVVTRTATQDISNKRVIDTLYFTDGVTINNEGEIEIQPSSHLFNIQANNGDLNLRTTATNASVYVISDSGDIVLAADGNSYIGTVAAGNRIATIDDLNSDTVIQSVSGTANQVTVGNTAGDVTVSLPSVIQIADLQIGNATGSSINLDAATGKIELIPSAGQVVSNGTLQVTGAAQFDSNVTITGDLNVQGNLNAVNRTEINLQDNTIRLNTGFTGSPSADAGIIVERGTANDTAIIWSEANDQWTLTNDGSNYYAIARKYVSIIGDASNTSFNVVHNLGTRDITVMVRENNADYNVVETDIRMTDANTVTIAFTDAPALNSYKVIIVG